MLFQEALNTALQLVVVLVICLVTWGLFARKRAGFFRWIGLVPPTMRSMGVALLIFIIWSLATAFMFLWPEVRQAASAGNTIAGKLGEAGFSGEIILVILLVGGIKTALAEEILFRGLFAKRLINGLGFWTGNTLHAILFGAIHLLIFVVPDGPAFSSHLAAVFLLVPGGAGWLMAFANEKTGNGSIAPGWLIHALGNTISYPILAFVV